MVSYEPEIIQKFAEGLYSQARAIITRLMVLGVVVGGPVGMNLFKSDSGGPPPGLIMGALVGAAIGYVFGADRAFKLRLQAQIALCQLQIEANTRGSVASSRSRREAAQ